MYEDKNYEYINDLPLPLPPRLVTSLQGQYKSIQTLYSDKIEFLVYHSRIERK